jgi:glycosyltransferase involved in cell wall biosynthesis
MSKRLPTLSVVVPTHQRPRELRRSLASIQKNISVDYELLLVSDVQCPQTRAVAGEFLRPQDQYFERGQTPGPAFSRNMGLAHARGQYVLFFDDDDELPPLDYDAFLHKAISAQHTVTYGDIVIVREDREKGVLTGEPLERPGLTAFPIEQLYVKNFIPLPAAIFPRLAIADLRFDCFMESLEDWEFLLQVYQVAEFSPVHSIAAVIYKDFVNLGNRRGSTEAARGNRTVLEYLYVYRRWPTDNPAVAGLRKSLIDNAKVSFVYDEFF